MTLGEGFERTRLLMVDDDTTLCELIRDYLEPHGFDVAMEFNGPSGLARAMSETFHVILLDLMMPGMDGIQLLHRLRASSQVPVLMLTGRGEETDRIVGLEVGADDYLPKTVSMRELLARLRAVLRRSASVTVAPPPKPGDPPIRIGDLVVDPGPREARVCGELLALTPAEFELLLSLARACGRVKTREQLIQEVSDRDLEAFERSIDVHISSLRRKIGDDAKNPRFIQTVRSAGYMLRRPESPQTQAMSAS
ncbi:MAG: response regulator transcription factor [Acidobacteria bacterium]|nr:response regulator transcription factor [Acidobacteriota bacterium]